MAETSYGAGGAHAAGESAKRTNHERGHRLGSDKKAHPGPSWARHHEESDDPEGL